MKLTSSESSRQSPAVQGWISDMIRLRLLPPPVRDQSGLRRIANPSLSHIFISHIIWNIEHFSVVVKCPVQWRRDDSYLALSSAGRSFIECRPGLWLQKRGDKQEAIYLLPQRFYLKSQPALFPIVTDLVGRNSVQGSSPFRGRTYSSPGCLSVLCFWIFLSFIFCPVPACRNLLMSVLQTWRKLGGKIHQIWCKSWGGATTCYARVLITM